MKTSKFAFEIVWPLVHLDFFWLEICEEYIQTKKHTIFFKYSTCFMINLKNEMWKKGRKIVRALHFGKGVKVNTTSDIQNTIIWHSTFCQFLKVMKHFYSLVITTNKVVVFKLCCTVISAVFCHKVECHKEIFWYLIKKYFFLGRQHMWITGNF